MQFSNKAKVPKLKIAIMELIIEKPQNHQFNRRFFFLSFLICFYCFNCFTAKAASALKSMDRLTLEIAPGFIMQGDSNAFALSESAIQEMAVPDSEIDVEIEQWMYISFNWKSNASDKKVISTDEESYQTSQEMLFCELFVEEYDPELSVESWMLESPLEMNMVK